MRGQEWESVNTHALVSVFRAEQSVRLTYRHSHEYPEISRELERLVMAENGCCGAAGVEFELDEQRDGMSVIINVVREGLPSHTVIAAFAAMSPSQARYR